MYKHTETGTIFYNFDQMRLWLVQNKDTAVSETMEGLAEALDMLGIVEYTPPPPEPMPVWAVTTLLANVHKSLKK